MPDIVHLFSSLRASKTFHLCTAVIGATLMLYLRGEVTWQVGGLVIAAASVAITIRHAGAKALEAILERLGVSPQTIELLEHHAAIAINEALEEHEGTLVAFLVARGASKAAAVQVAEAFVDHVTDKLDAAAVVGAATSSHLGSLAADATPQDPGAPPAPKRAG